MRVQRLVFAGQAALILITILTAVVAIVALETTARNGERVAEGLATEITLADRLRLDAERLVATSRGYLLSGEEESKSHFQEMIMQLESTLARVSGTQGVAATAAIERHAREYIGVVERGAARRALANDPHAAIDVFDELKAKRLVLEHDVDELASGARGRFDAERRDSIRLARHAQLALAVTSVIALALSMGLATLFYRTLMQQVRRLESTSELAQRAATSRQELLTVVSHDLRNPLHAVVLAASALRMSPSDPPLRCLDSIEHAATQMQRLVDELMDTARIEQGEIELRRASWRADALVADALGLFHEAAALRGIGLRSEAIEPALVHVDRDRVLQVFSNLIGNALKFVGAGGDVIVRARSAGGDVRFEVVDTGQGIAPHEVLHVFDRYYRGPRQNERAGLGMGLYICKQLVDAHHGRIGVESVEGRGTTFWFTLPNEPACLT